MRVIVCKCIYLVGWVLEGFQCVGECVCVCLRVCVCERECVCVCVCVCVSAAFVRSELDENGAWLKPT